MNPDGGCDVSMPLLPTQVRPRPEVHAPSRRLRAGGYSVGTGQTRKGNSNGTGWEQRSATIRESPRSALQAGILPDAFVLIRQQSSERWGGPSNFERTAAPAAPLTNPERAGPRTAPAPRRVGRWLPGHRRCSRGTREGGVPAESPPRCPFRSEPSRVKGDPTELDGDSAGTVPLDPRLRGNSAGTEGYDPSPGSPGIWPYGEERGRPAEDHVDEVREQAGPERRARE